MHTRYIHIGYPKNLSTTLQRGFFDKHPQIMHLGIGCGDNVSYHDTRIANAVELYLQYCKDYKYAENRDWITDHFHELFRQCDQHETHRAVGLSLEHLSFSFTPDNIDVTTKAYRLFEIFGPDTRIVMIVREQMDLLRSLYRECIRTGYPGSFAEYCEYAYKFQERSFLYDFLYDKTWSLYTSLFGRENVQVYPIEQYREEGRLTRTATGRITLLDDISQFLGVDYQDMEPGHFNRALDEGELLAKRDLNKQYRHDLGNSQYSSANTHRIQDYYSQDLQVPAPQCASMDVQTKRFLISQARSQAWRYFGQTIDYSLEPGVESGLKNLFAASNERLQRVAGVQTGYPGSVDVSAPETATGVMEGVSA